ncbi:sulfotransferase family protein [Rhodovibrionaceae bacterium A322]
MQPDLRNFLYNKERGFVFAYAPKVACSNWKAVMRYLAGCDDYLDPRLLHNRKQSGLTYLADDEESWKLLADPGIKKLTFVRDPYSRLLSAYLNKIEENIPKIGTNKSDTFDFVRITELVDEFRLQRFNPIQFPEITFEVFLYWLRDSGSWLTQNEHWRTQSNLLAIDKVDFDFTGRFETIDQDAPKLLEIMGCDIELPTQKAIQFAPMDASKKVKTYYSDICTEIVNKIYADDFARFNYPMRHVDPVVKRPSDQMIRNLQDHSLPPSMMKSRGA